MEPGANHSRPPQKHNTRLIPIQDHPRMHCIRWSKIKIKQAASTTFLLKDQTLTCFGVTQLCYKKWSQPAYPPNNNWFRDQWVEGLRWFPPYRAVISLNGTRGKSLQTSPKALYHVDTHPRIHYIRWSKKIKQAASRVKKKLNTTFLLKDQTLTCFGVTQLLLQEMKSTSISTQQTTIDFVING